MLKFSANLGFLWNNLPLPAAIHAAKKAGFDAVECHWPFSVSAMSVKAALAETELQMIGLNTWPGDLAAGDFGLGALPDRTRDAIAGIDQAIHYAHQIGAANIHVMAGKTAGKIAQQTFVETLEYATRKAQTHNITILIEPLNGFDAPGYLVNSLAIASEIMDEVDAPNLKLMFDCYHVHRMGDDVISQLQNLYAKIGHIQIAASPDRGAPDHGDLSYADVFTALEHLGHTAPIGAEYKPIASTEQSLNWLKAYRGQT